MRHRILAVALLSTALATLAGCASPPPPKQPQPVVPQHRLQRAQAHMAPVSGTLVSGKLMVFAVDGGVRIEGELGGLGRNGTHAIHIHERGDCSAADGSSAGGHFNPAATAHGRVGHGAHHAGDMDNIVADARGVAKVNVRAEGVTLGSGAASEVTTVVAGAFGGTDSPPQL